MVQKSRKQAGRGRARPGTAWKLQDAKAAFSDVVRRAEAEGPQTVTRHGKPVAVVVSAEDYARKLARRPFKAFLTSVAVEGFEAGDRHGDDRPRDVPL